MGILPIYIFGALANALVSSINSRKQLAHQKLMADENRQAQNEIQRRQMAAQREIQIQNYRQQISNQLRSLKATNWPLDMLPEQIAESIRSCRNVPLYLIIAPSSQNGIQHELESVWQELGRFFAKNFQVNSETPVIHGGYRHGFPVNPISDISKIYEDIKSVPTLYIAPYSTMRDNVLGIIIAFWGVCHIGKPSIQSFEVDIRKLYIDTIRDEAIEYERRCSSGALKWDEQSQLARNFKIFSSEAECIRNGIDTTYLDQAISYYKDIKPSKLTYITLTQKIYPLMALLSSAIVDLYFVLEYGTTPLFPQIVNQFPVEGSIPSLILKDGIGLKNSGEIDAKTFSTQLLQSYSAYLGAQREQAKRADCMSMLREQDLPTTSLGAETSEAPQPRRTANYRTNSLSSIKKLFREKNYGVAFRSLQGMDDCKEVRYYLGVCYMNAWGCEQSFEKAIRCFTQSAVEGCAESQFRIAGCYYQLGQNALYEKWLTAAANSGHEKAIQILSDEKKKGIPKMQEEEKNGKRGFFGGVVDTIAEGVVNAFTRDRKYVPVEKTAITYDELYQFALKCKKQFPNVALCRVTCSFEADKNWYKILQMPLDARGKAITERERCVGRMFYATALDRQISVLMGGKDVANFDIPIRSDVQNG